MKHLKILVVALGVFIGLAKCRTEEEAAVKIAEINAKLIDEVQNVYQASWDFVSNITKYNEGKKNEAAAKYAQFLKTTAHELMEYNFESFEDETLKRQFRMMVLIGDSALDESDFNELTQAIGSMQSTYAKAKVPKFNNNSELMSLEPEITNILLTSKDPEELQYYWVQWHDLTGRTSRDNFFKYVGLRNKAAELNSKKFKLKYCALKEIFR